MSLSTSALRLAFLVVPVLFSACGSGEKKAPLNSGNGAHPRPLNILLITVDTLRPDHLHCYGYPDIDTPVIDGIARRGVLFENAVTETPLTPPSHASIFTGQNPNVHKVRNTGGFVLQSSSHPVARILKEQGWDTAAFIGSAVLKKVFGFNNGFALYDDEMPRPGKRTEFRDDPERNASAVVDRAVAWLNRRTSQSPFFLWVHLYDPHLPYNRHPEFGQKYDHNLYDGEIAYVDTQLGRLFDAVGKKYAPESTVIALLSDHGESLGQHGERTHGVFIYDSTLRIAFVIAGPGIPRGVRVKQQVRAIDFLPTLLEIVGAPAPDGIQGVSLIPALTGKNVPTDVAYAETLYPKMNMNWSELRAIRTNRWKYIRAPHPELYDLASDPLEAHNVVQQHAPEVQKFEAQIKHIISPSGNGTEKVETAMVDERVMNQLKSLGYLSGVGGRSYELTGSGPDPKDEVKVLSLLDEAESADTNLSEARRTAMLRLALEQDPGNPSAYYQLGGRLEKNGHYDEALQLYRTALSRGIDSGRLHSRIADLLVRRGDKAAAITEYEKASQINPVDLDTQSNLGTAYLEQGRLADAERVFQWVLTNDADYAAAQNGLGLVFIQRQNPRAAQPYFERAVALDPDLLEAQVNLGLIYEMAGDRARARSSFEAFLAKASPAQYGQIIPRVRQELATLQ